VCVRSARAALPPIEGLASVRYLTNASIFNLNELPRRLAVIGGGAVSCELAQAFARFGSRVVVLQRSNSVSIRTHEGRIICCSIRL
jgi:pyruvate/2-oxoglutarate dehydrogenase complex dihydrolipoamide dehydrogenase (E3) component